jgi:hypothetical protein
MSQFLAAIVVCPFAVSVETCEKEVARHPFCSRRKRDRLRDRLMEVMARSALPGTLNEKTYLKTL